MKKSYYITTPIYYVNDKPHIGHAYTSIAADVLARFKRMDGYNVYFLTGVDEHGQKVQKSAENAGMKPQDFVDSIAKHFKTMGDNINLSNDDFIRTSDEHHKKACQAFWIVLQEKGYIKEGTYSGWYATRDEAFYIEDETIVNDTGTRVAKTTGAEVHWAEEETYFFRLSEFQERLLTYYEENPDCIHPKSRYNEVVSFVKRGLRDLSISRTSFSWGILVPNNPKHIMYVWLDALTNYISALGYPNIEGKMKTFWPADVHMVGKDIIIFHAVYWPAFLMAAGLALPKCIVAHGWWTNQGQKISKSLGNTIDINTLIETYGADQTRYFLLREVPFGQDGDYSTEAMLKRINGDLANDLGNLYQRTLSLVHKHFQGIIPERKALATQDKEIDAQSTKLLPEVRAFLDKQDFYHALTTIWDCIRGLNAYIDKQAPWALKEDKERMGTILATILYALKKITLILHPWMPTITTEAYRQLGMGGMQELTFESFNEPMVTAAAVAPPVPLFKKHEE